MKKYDVSIHFTLKNQTIEEVERKFDDWLKSDKYIGQFDFSENDIDNEPRNILHHCFLSKEKVIVRNIGMEVWDFLDAISEHIVCWSGVGGEHMGITWDRIYMLQNIKKVDGIAVFIGDIIDGVAEEYAICQDQKIDCIVIT